MTIAIKKCYCEHKYQDQRYGKGKRVMNAKEKKEPQNYRCTVCGKETT